MIIDLLISVPVLIYCISCYLFVHYNTKCIDNPLERLWQKGRLIFFITALGSMAATVAIVDLYHP